MSEESFNVCFGEVRSMLAALEDEDYPDYTNLFALLSRIARRHSSAYREILKPYLLGAGVPVLLPPPERREDNTFDWDAWLDATGLAIASSPDGPLALDLSSVPLDDAWVTSLRAQPWFTRLIWLDLRGSRLASSLILTMENTLSKEARVFPVSFDHKYHEGANFTQLFAPWRDFSWLDFENVSFEEAYLEGSDFSYCQLIRANFKNANLERVNFRLAQLEGADLGYASLAGAHFQKTDLENANLEHANLRSAEVSQVRLEGANLKGANLTGVIFRSVRYNHDTVWPEGFDYRARRLIGPGGKLDGAILTKALLEGVDLEHANLEGADLTNVSLKNANLKSANLTRAKLEGANLKGANLEGTNLEGARLMGVAHDAKTRWPEGFDRARLAPEPDDSSDG